MKPAFKVGQRVNVVCFGQLRINDTIAEIVQNDSGLTLYWLDRGGCFDESEITLSLYSSGKNKS